MISRIALGVDNVRVNSASRNNTFASTRFFCATGVERGIIRVVEPDPYHAKPKR